MADGSEVYPGYTLVKEDSGYVLYTDEGEREVFQDELNEIDDFMRIHLLPIDADLFKTAFQSFAYTNWMKEKAADIDEQGNSRYPGLTKTPETLIMYLMELGISADTLVRYMYGPENKYMEYRYLVQEFGKML